MKKLDRYISKQVLVGTLYAVAILSMMLVLGNLFKIARPLLVEQRAPPILLFKALITVLPSTLMFTLPWGFLATVLLTFGRLSADNEINGMRMAGKSLTRIAMPVFVIAALLSALSFYLNATIAPRSKAIQKQLLVSTIRENPAALLTPGVVQSRFKEGSVFVEGIGETDRELKRFHFYKFPSQKSSPDGPSMLEDQLYLYAKEAKLQIIDKPDTKQLRLALHDTYLENHDENGEIQPHFAKSFEPLLFDSANFLNRGKNKPSGMDNATIRQKLADPGDLSEKNIKRLRSELTKRYSFSLACFSFAIVGVPLAISGQRKDTSRGFGLSLAIAGGYFLFLVIAQNLGDKGLIIMWLPNVICILLGLFLLQRARFR